MNNNYVIMDYEKKYEEALARAKEQLEGANVFDYKEEQIAHDIRTTTYAIFPELKESEDEKTRKRIIALVNAHGQGMYKDDMLAWIEKQGEIDKESYEIAEKEKREFIGDGFIKCYADFQDFKEGKTYWLEYLGNDDYNVRSDNLLGKTYHITPCQLYTIFKKMTWLEKQGEQKFIWDENDDWIRTKIIKVLLDSELTPEETNECIFWLKSLKDRTFPQPKQEWSEEDEKKRKRIMHRLSIDGTINNEDLADINEWLKSLRLQSHWKPSDEQMKALAWALSLAKNCGEECAFDLRTLQDQLKKLTEE